MSQKVKLRIVEEFEFEFNERDFPELYKSGVLDKELTQEKLLEGDIFGEGLHDISTDYKKMFEVVFKPW